MSEAWKMNGSGGYGDGIAVGARIGQARRELGLTQADLASRIGVTLGVVDRYETGKADPSGKLEEIAEVTGRSASWFTSTAPYEFGAGGYEDELPTELGRRVAETIRRNGRANSDLAKKQIAAGSRGASVGGERPDIADAYHGLHEDRTALARQTELQTALAEEQRRHEEAAAQAARLAEEREVPFRRSKAKSPR